MEGLVIDFTGFAMASKGSKEDLGERYGMTMMEFK